MDKKTADRYTLLRHMKEIGGITGKEASDLYGITRCAARISELREEGYIIDSQWETGPRRDQKIARWVRYILVEEPEI